MKIIPCSASALFTPHGAQITGLASPSRGSREISVWRVRLEPGSTPEHTLDAEEIFAILGGKAVFQSGSVRSIIQEGDTVIVAPGDRISFDVAEGDFMEAICAMRAGAKATMIGSTSAPFSPPWTE